MFKMKKKKPYFCRFCGKQHKSFYMAEICAELDMKVLAHKNQTNDKEKITEGHTKGRGSRIA